MKSNATLVKIIPRGELASLVTCRKDGGKSPTFLFFRQRMLQWLQESSGARYYESDMYSYLSAYGGGNGEEIHFTLTLLSSAGPEDSVRGYIRRFQLPRAWLLNALASETPSRFLSHGENPSSRIVFQNCQSALRRISLLPKTRRALCKALRDCFQWPGEVVRLYPDGGDSFYFTTQSGFPACGGLVLHASDLATPGGTTRQLRYEVHT